MVLLTEVGGWGQLSVLTSIPGVGALPPSSVQTLEFEMSEKDGGNRELSVSCSGLFSQFD